MFYDLHQYRNYMRILACILLQVCFLCSMNHASSEMRIEDLNYFDTKGTAYAFSEKYMLSAKGSHAEDWWPTQYTIMLTDLYNETMHEIETVFASHVHLLSDGEMFYIVANQENSEQSEESFLSIGVLDVRKGSIDWHKLTHLESNFPNSDDLSDVLIVNKNLFLIFSSHIVKYFTIERTYECFFYKDLSIVNHYFLNHACVYEDDIYLQDARGWIFVIDTEDGSFRKSEMRAEVYRPGKYDAELGRYKYYVYGSELIYPEAYGSFKQMVAYNFQTKESRVVFDGAFSMFFHDENGIYIDLIDYGTGKYKFLLEENEINIFPKEQFQLLEIMKGLIPQSMKQETVP